MNSDPKPYQQDSIINPDIENMRTRRDRFLSRNARYLYQTSMPHYWIQYFQFLRIVASAGDGPWHYWFVHIYKTYQQDALMCTLTSTKCKQDTTNFWAEMQHSCNNASLWHSHLVQNFWHLRTLASTHGKTSLLTLHLEIQASRTNVSLPTPTRSF